MHKYSTILKKFRKSDVAIFLSENLRLRVKIENPLNSSTILRNYYAVIFPFTFITYFISDDISFRQ